MRTALLVLVAACAASACGRVGFDATGDGGTDPNVDAPPTGPEPTNYALDLTFDDTGYSVVAIGANTDEVPFAAIVSGGRLFSAGIVRDNIAARVGFELLAFAETGDLDPAVGQGGRFVANHPPNSVSDFAFAAAHRRTTDQFYVAGDGIQTMNGDDMQVARFAATGELDTTFGTGGFGHVHIQNEDTSHAVVVDGEDRILLCGAANYDLDGDVAIARLLSTGQLDPSFGTAGVAVYPHANMQMCEGIAVAPDGGIWLAGSSGPDVVIGRALADGTPDTNFAGVGELGIANGYSKCVAALGPNIITGGVQDGLPALGTFDPSGGQVFVASIQVGMQGSIEAIVVDDHGRIVIAGYLGTTVDDPVQSFVARLLPNGDFDPSFNGTDGIVIVDLPGAERLEGLAIDGTGRIYATGHVGSHSAFAFRLKPE